MSHAGTGYHHPIPQHEEIKLRSLLPFAKPASVIDPCVGPWRAVDTHRRHACEFDNILKFAVTQGRN
jgi:hypothetical protein